MAQCPAVWVVCGSVQQCAAVCGSVRQCALYVYIHKVARNLFIGTPLCKGQSDYIPCSSNINYNLAILRVINKN
jgi:hypothetical protein